MLNLQSYWRPTGRNFGAPKNMGGLCFQVLGSLGVLGVLGVFVFKTPVFVANFVAQLDNFWKAGRYFNKLNFIKVCVKVCLILVFSFCRLNICCLILSLTQTQNLKLISFFCRSPVSGNTTSNSVFYKWNVKVF